MAGPKSFVTDAELGILKVLWAEGAQPARAIAEELYEGADRSAMGTVQKLLARLEAKQLVRRDRSGGAHRFSARLTREDVAGMQLDEFAEKLSDGSLSPFVLHLVNTGRLSEEEKNEIRRILDEEQQS